MAEARVLHRHFASLTDSSFHGDIRGWGVIFRRMPDPLDPLDAVVSGFKDTVERFVGVIAASFGGHLLGFQVHAFAPVLASIPTKGPAAWPGVLVLDPLGAVLSWFGTFFGSLAIPWCWPFLVLDVWLLMRLRLTGELFPVIVVLLATQPIHSFLAQRKFSPLTGGETGIGLGLLVVSAIFTTTLLLWWRSTSDHAPAPLDEEEPEL